MSRFLTDTLEGVEITRAKDVKKHGDHDQSSHGSWATGVTEELSKWSPKEKVPDAPRNATGTSQKFWDNWEHGVDGDQFVDLYRQYAGEMLGLPVPKSDKDVGGSENYLTQRGFGASSTEAVRNQTEAVLNAIANGRPQPTLYRGMAGGSEESKALLEQFTRLEEGDTIDMPLVSTTRSLGVAQWYAVDRSRTPNDSRVILKIQEGAKGVSVNPEKSWYPSDFETITSGKFEVVGKSEVTVPYWDRRATSARTFTLRGDDGQDGKTGYRIDDPNDLSWGSVDSLDPRGKDRYDAIVSGARTGDFSKIETPTLKYTNDRQPSGVKEGRDVTVNSWKRQEPKTFTVIEVKMVEPHVVKKGADLGMTFHNLFNDIPFIRDEEEVTKHGDHDQSSHGSWAQGVQVAPEIVRSTLERVKENGGLSVSLKDGSEPTKGFMVAKGKKFAAIVKADDFFDEDKGAEILSSYMKQHKSEFNNSNNYLGLWHNTDDGQVYLDVSENIKDEGEAISRGRDRDQISIWDVANFKEIETGGTGGIEKTRSGRTALYVEYDGRTN